MGSTKYNETLRAETKIFEFFVARSSVRALANISNSRSEFETFWIAVNGL